MYPACARQVVGQGGSVERSPGGDRGGSTGGRRAAHGSCLVLPFCFRGFGIGTRTWARRRNHYKNNGYGISPDRFPLDGARGGQRELARLSGRWWGLLADPPSAGRDYSTDLLQVAKEIRETLRLAVGFGRAELGRSWRTRPRGDTLPSHFWTTGLLPAWVVQAPREAPRRGLSPGTWPRICRTGPISEALWTGGRRTPPSVEPGRAFAKSGTGIGPTGS